MFKSLAKFFPSIGAQRVKDTNQSRRNALAYADPEKLSRAITSFRAGNLREMALIIDELEDRDDITRTASRKAYTAISRCPHQILIREGEEKNDRAKLHQEVLTKFWATIRVRDLFAQNADGGMRLLKKNMAEAISRVWSAHEVVWDPQPDGTIRAQFIKVPLWYFENRNGSLRLLPTDTSLEGRELEPDGWLISQGDGVGIAAAVAAVAKRLSLQDWLLFSERCGMPGVHAATDATFESDEWNNLVASVAGFGRDYRMVTGKGVEIKGIDLRGSGELPYPPLVSRMDRAIAALYRGADLSTISAEGDQAGASVQGDETRMIDADVCEMVSEALQQQIEPFVIRWTLGDSEPLAYISIAPASNPNLDREMSVDKHLMTAGIKLSKSEMLQRYGRTEAKDPADVAEILQTVAAAGPAPVLSNERMLKMYQDYFLSETKRLSNIAEIIKLAESAALPNEKTPDQAYEEAALSALAEAQAKGFKPLVDALKDALAIEDDSAFVIALQKIRAELPTYLEKAAADQDTINLFERILLGAVQQGKEQSK